MNKRILSIIALLLISILCINITATYPAQAGAFADLFGIQDDSGGFITDNSLDFGMGKLSDASTAAKKAKLMEAMRKFRLAERLRKTGKFNKATKHFRNQTTSLINQGSRIGKATKFLGGAMMILNIYNTSADTYKLITEDSKHDTFIEKTIDKTLGAVDAGMGWYAIGLGLGAIITAPTVGAGVVAAGAVTGATYLVTKITVGVSRIAFNSQTYRNVSGFLRGKKKIMFAPFTRPGMKEGLDIIKEELGFDLYPGLKREIPDPKTGIPVYKPNIYIYSDKDLSINVKLYPAHWITKSIPTYDIYSGWDADVVNGSLNAKEDFLFYEAIVPDEGFQKEYGFVVKRQTLNKDMNEIMNMYGFTQKETDDFIEFWNEMLDHDKDYVFYPQETTTVDYIMPLVTDKTIDSYFRLWFYIVEKTPETLVQECNITKIERHGLTIVEWGGIIK